MPAELKQTWNLGSVQLGEGAPLFLIAGPCVIESREHCLDMAGRLVEVCREVGLPLIFKASYDKANRTSVDSFRGPGLDQGLAILEEVKDVLGVPLLSDIHSTGEAKAAARVLDVLQIPAFLCRQTDLITAAAGTGKTVNLKKGQFLAPWDIGGAVNKAEAAGGRHILLTERGASFGYNNLVVDMRSLPLMRDLGHPVVLDVTHALQLPGGLGSRSGGQSRFIEQLARAGVGCGLDGLFMEVHPCPDKALCDGPNSLPLERLRPLLEDLREIDRIVKNRSERG